MPKFNVNVTLRRHILANGKIGDTGPAMFARDSVGRVVIPHPCWHKALNSAVRAGGIQCLNADEIRMGFAFKAETVMYSRAYKADGIPHVRVHEAIPDGASVTWTGVTMRIMRVELLMNLFDTLGTYVGMTPFGYTMGFGRFIVNKIAYELENQS